MDPLIDRLRQQTDGFNPAGLTPGTGLPTVVKRGKRYVAATAAATLLSASAAFAAGAVLIPGVIERIGVQTPTVVSTPAEETGTTPTEAPVEDADLLPEADDKPSDAAADEDAPKEDAAAGEDGADTTAPSLAVLSPADGATVDGKTVTFAGTVEPGSTVKVGNYVATVDDEGEWSLVLIAAKGLNTVTFTAKDAAGNATVVVRKLTYVSAETPDPKQDDKDPVNDATPQPFTANQQHNELTSAPYTNVYWGTTTPGTKIKVLSDYGWDYVYADDAGSWELAVTFTPPAGTTTFQVTARHYHDESVSTTFTLTTVAGETEPFTSSQQNSSVPASSPVNTYSGTGEPGHEVLIWTQDHGQTTTTIANDGTWSVTFEYADVVAGATFDVKARDMTGGTYEYFSVTITEG